MHLIITRALGICFGIRVKQKEMFTMFCQLDFFFVLKMNLYYYLPHPKKNDLWKKLKKKNTNNIHLGINKINMLLLESFGMICLFIKN